MKALVERLIGGYLTPILILAIGVLYGQHITGDTPGYLGPALLLVAVLGTSQYRRPTAPTYQLRTLWSPR